MTCVTIMVGLLEIFGYLPCVEKTKGATPLGRSAFSYLNVSATRRLYNAQGLWISIRPPRIVHNSGCEPGGMCIFMMHYRLAACLSVWAALRGNPV